MILLRYHRLVTSLHHPAFVSYATLGKVYGIDGSSVRRLIIKRLKKLNSFGIKTRK